MSAIKKQMTALIQAQPDSATCEDILRELAFARMVERGLADARAGWTVSHTVMEGRVRSWPK